MMAAASPCRTYIVYHHGLFAQGVRSVLEERRGVQIVGMESDVAKALKAVRSLRPEVIIVEQSAGKHRPMRLGAFLYSAGAGRVVTLSLNHDFATVYDRRRVAATDPADLVKAIRGARNRKQQVAGPDPQPEKAVVGTQSEAGRNGNEDQTGRGSRVRRALKEEEKKPQTVPRPSRGKKKGG